MHISIHAPHAGCDGCADCTEHRAEISIHAPHAGCDALTFRGHSVNLQFQSTHPMRGATCRLRICNLTSKFQSTHPMRGATSKFH